MRSVFFTLIVGMGLGFVGVTPALADTMGSDYESIPRVTGSEIYGYAATGYDVGTFFTKDPAADSNKKVIINEPEGARTRILYMLKPGDTPIMAMRNYDVALAELGEVSERFHCRNDCSNHKLSTTLWTKDTMVPTEGLQSPFYMLGFTHNYGNASYKYVEVVTDESKFHIGIFAAVLGAKNPSVDFRNRTAVLVEILEIEDFEPTLEFVDASQMQSEISQVGYIALYGIQFNNNEATYTPESETTLNEIAKTLSADPALHLYVVGHTDDVGALDYNNDLSRRRAEKVVNALVTSGISQERLTPIGIGPAAPIGSNDSEEGRALNRRVELVKRKTGST